MTDREFREKMDALPTVPKATDEEQQLLAGLIHKHSDGLISAGIPGKSLAYDVLTEWRAMALRGEIASTGGRR